MHGAHFLDEILVFLIAAVVVVSIFRWLKVSPILGYLSAGLMIGPHAFEFIDDAEQVKVFGDLGVIFLMFSIGLKMPLQRLKMLSEYVFGMGAAQFLLTTGLFGFITHFFVHSAETAFFIGACLALSSTAVSMQVLAERGESASRFGRVSFSVLLFQDLSVVVLLVLLTSMKDGNGNLGIILALATGKAIVALLSIIFLGRVILRPVFRLVASLNNQELFVATTLLVVLATGMLTAAADLSMELGAFLAGLLISETEYRHQVEADIQPYHGLLLGLFFMSVGMNIHLSLFINQFWIVCSLITILIITKFVLMTAIGRFFSLPLASSMRVALLLATGGEFVFVLFDPAVEAGILSKQLSDILTLSVAISMVFTPFLAILGKTVEDWISSNEAEATIASAEDEVEDLKHHVIIAGFGRVGKLMAQVMSQEIIPFVAIDNDMARVAEGRARGYPVFYGDARRAMVMKALGIAKAREVVVCLDTDQSVTRTALMLRRNFPDVEVCARIQDRQFEEKLAKSGVSVVMPESLEPTLQLAASALRGLGTPADEISQIIGRFRDDYMQSSPATLEEESEETDESAASAKA